jgi:hypothetical protein
VNTSTDRRLKRRELWTRSIGTPRVDGPPAFAKAMDLYALEIPLVTDDAKPARLVTVHATVDGAYLRELVAAARAAGWAE